MILLHLCFLKDHFGSPGHMYGCAGCTLRKDTHLRKCHSHHGPQRTVYLLWAFPADGSKGSCFKEIRKGVSWGRASFSNLHKGTYGLAVTLLHGSGGGQNWGQGNHLDSHYNYLGWAEREESLNWGHGDKLGEKGQRCVRSIRPGDERERKG